MSERRPSRDEIAAERRTSLNRRRFLRGVGACLALPALESLKLPGAAASAKLASTATGAPLRTAFVYVPNGAIQPTWWPKGTGTETDFELNRTMAPLQGVKRQIQVFSGLDHVNATPGPDGPGDHARASGTFLTGVRVKKTAGANIHAGVSIDQVVASRVGHLTRFPSLELSCDAVRRSGNCDSGYSCAYQYNLAWRSPTTPVPPEPNPRLLFERLFGSGAPGERQASLKHRQERQRSILDFVRDDARTLQKGLAPRDQRKLDEYLASVREVETRIAQAEHLAATTPDPQVETPPGIPPGHEDHIRLMYDLLALAFETDSTRVATLLVASEGSNRSFPEIGVTEGHHSLTHHQNQKDMMDKVADIDRFYVRQFARFLERLARSKDLDGRSVLDNSMIVFGSGNADGNRHTHTNLPVILAGGGGGALRPGRYVTLGAVPMTNMFLGLAARLGVTDLDRLGDSTGRFDGV
jgi:Protein of unknown function (DUF1552)